MFINNKFSGAGLASALVLAAGLSACKVAESPAELVTAAKQHIAKGDRSTAVIELKNALSASPNDAEARLLLGTLYNQVGDAASAEKELRRALALTPGNLVALRELGIALLVLQKHQNLLDETASAAAMADARILALRGNAQLALKQNDAAKASYDRALAITPAQVNAMLGLGQHALAQGDSAGAVRLVDAAIAAHPKDPDALMMKAAVLGASGNRDGALAAYTAALELAPDNRSARFERSFLYIGSQRYDEARADIDAIRKASPGNLMAVYADGLMDYSKSNFVAARDAVAKVLRVAPEHMPSVLLAGAVELKLGAYQQAERHLKKYVETEPKNDYARRMLASAYLKLGQPADALAVLAQYIADDSADEQMLGLAAEAHLQAQQYEKATILLERARAKAPNVAAVHTAIAVAKIGQGDDASAVNALELSTKLDANTNTAGILLVLTEMRLKNYDKALVAVQALERAHPKDPTVPNLKGGVYLAMKDFPKARAAFDAAMVLQPTFFASLANLAQLDLQEKKPEQARQRVEAYLVKEPKNHAATQFLATLALSQGKVAESTKWFELGSANNPGLVAPAVQLAGHYLRIGQHAKALDLMRKFQSAHPADPELLGMLGEAQIINGDIPGAIESFGKQARVMPKSASPHTRLASLHLRQKNMSAAADDFQRALSIEPKNLEATMGKLELLARGGKLDQALVLARKVEQDHPASAIGYVAEGDLLMLQKKTAPAIAAYEKALQLNRSPAAMLKVIAALKYAGRGSEADARIALWTKAMPEDGMVPNFVAEEHLSNGRYKAAIPIFEKLLARQPGNPIMLNNLALAYQQEKDPRAAATAQRALALEPNSPAVLDTAGWIMLEAGDSKNGLTHLRRAVLLSPNSGEIRYHLALGLLKTGDKAGAKAELTLALAREPGFRFAKEAKQQLAAL